MEIKNYGHEEQKKKLIAGIVLTGGGSQLKHLKQLVEYITGMDTRIGYPNEHLAGDSNEDVTSPLYATAVGLLMNAIETQPRMEQVVDPVVEEEQPSETATEDAQKPKKAKQKNFFERWAETFIKFIDEAE